MWGQRSHFPQQFSLFEVLKNVNSYFTVNSSTWVSGTVPSYDISIFPGGFKVHIIVRYVMKEYCAFHQNVEAVFLGLSISDAVSLWN